MDYYKLSPGRCLAWIALGVSLFSLDSSVAIAQQSRAKSSMQRDQVLRDRIHIVHGPANMLEMIQQDNSLKGFTELLQITGLQDYVKTAPITVFAPQDPACDPLLKQARMWRDQKNQKKLAALSTSVKHHLLAGKYMWRPGAQKDVKQLQGDTLEMASGFRLAVYPTSSGGSLTIQVSNSRRARVIKQDIVAPNGILFIIDRPLDAHSVNID
jgi:uncharacterized surface protein with fasciclin (FAS1) repeats